MPRALAALVVAANLCWTTADARARAPDVQPGARTRVAASGERPQRIVSLIPATTEMLFAMGAGDRVVAVGSYDHFPPEVERLPRVGALLDPNVERILAMKPDLVVLYGTQTELQTQLTRARIAYFSYSLGGLSDIAASVRALGSRVGAAGAEGLATRIETQLAEIRSRVAGRPRPRISAEHRCERGQRLPARHAAHRGGD